MVKTLSQGGAASRGPRFAARQPPKTFGCATGASNGPNAGPGCRTEERELSKPWTEPIPFTHSPEPFPLSTPFPFLWSVENVERI